LAPKAQGQVKKFDKTKAIDANTRRGENGIWKKKDRTRASKGRKNTRKAKKGGAEREGRKNFNQGQGGGVHFRIPQNDQAEGRGETVRKTGQGQGKVLALMGKEGLSTEIGAEKGRRWGGQKCQRFGRKAGLHGGGAGDQDHLTWVLNGEACPEKGDVFVEVTKDQKGGTLDVDRELVSQVNSQTQPDCMRKKGGFFKREWG